MTSTDVWAGSATLDELRALPAIVYRTFTVLGPVGGVDGSLQSVDGQVDYPLDLYTPLDYHGGRDRLEAIDTWAVGKVLAVNDYHAVAVPREAITHATVRDAVTRWAREHLGRTDIAFAEDE